MKCYIPSKLYKLWPLFVGTIGIAYASINLWGVASVLWLYVIYIIIKRVEYYISE